MSTSFLKKLEEFYKSGISTCCIERVTDSERLLPFDWRNSFGEQYLQSIRFICLAMSDEYIDSHFEEIKSHGSDIETRLDDSNCSAIA